MGINKLIEDAGFASQIKQASSGMWADAHRPGGLIRNEMQCSIIEAEVLKLIEENPVGAALSDFGKMHFVNYWFLLSDADCERFMDRRENPYPYRFELKDVLLESREIIKQLVADEYFMGGPESTPFTPEYCMERKREFKDIFTTFDRPDVTIEMVRDNISEIIQLNNGKPSPKPSQGFKQV